MDIFEKSVVITGTNENRKMVILLGCKYASKIKSNFEDKTKVTWLCETDEDVHDLIDIECVLDWNCDIDQLVG